MVISSSSSGTLILVPDTIFCTSQLRDCNENNEVGVAVNLGVSSRSASYSMASMTFAHGCHLVHLIQSFPITKLNQQSSLLHIVA